jgi:hypothetical protein
MNNANKLFLGSSVIDMRPNSAFGETYSDVDVHIQDKKVAQLLLLLQQLDESAAGLGALPKHELNEILTSAIRVCGFVDPLEAQVVMATVFEAIEERGPAPESP